MRRIDFLGTNGVGKSTLYTELLNRRSDPSQWLTRIEAKRKIAADTLLDDAGPGDYAKAASCFLPRLGDIFVETFTRRPAERAFARADDTYRQFFEHCLRHVSAEPTSSRARSSSGRARASGPGTAIDYLQRAPTSDTDTDTDDATAVRRADRESMQCVNLSWLFGRLKELCLLNGLDDTVIFDESLTHSTAGLILTRFDESTLQTHFEKIPVPDAVIHLRASSDDIVERLQQRASRRGPSMRHETLDADGLRDMTERALRIAEVGACTLDWRGADVLSVDTTDRIETNIAEIEAFLGHSPDHRQSV